MSDQDHPPCQEDTHCSTGEAPTADADADAACIDADADADAACIDADAAEVAGSAGGGGAGGAPGGVRGADHCPALAPMGFPVGRPMALQ